MRGYYNSSNKKNMHAPSVSKMEMTRSASNSDSFGNMALAQAIGAHKSTGRTAETLGNELRHRIDGVHEHRQAQIPQAESEADRLSSAVRVGTPDSVKEVMGRRMGADFSGVRFHTGAAAAAKADAMGARAYTSGADVYFGSGGFDASVAAHELVHTAQQGMVDSGASVMSTPAGGVQMMPNPFKGLWNKTGGRAIRKQHDAMIELDEAMHNGDWNSLSTAERMKWKAKNPVAYNRYMHSSKARNETGKRAEKRKKEKDLATLFLNDPRADLEPSSMLTQNGKAGEWKVGRGVTDKAEAPAAMKAGDVVDKAGDIAGKVDNVMIPPGVANAMQEAKWIGQFGEDALGGTLGGVGIMTGITGSVKSIKDIKEAFTERGATERMDAFADLGGNLAKIGGGAGAIAKAAGQKAGGMVGGIADIVTGGVDMYKGGRQFYHGARKHHAMKNFQKENFGNQKREDMAGNDLLLRDIATQGKMEGTRQKIKGSGKALTGVVDAAAGLAEVSGAGAGVGAGLKAGNAVLKTGFAAANRFQKNRMVNKVVEQTSGLTEEKIRLFQDVAGIKSYSRAKQALMKSMGYETGSRAELYADQTEKRGQYLAEQANKDPANKQVQSLVSGLGVKKKKSTNAYDQEDMAKSLGLWKSRSKIASGHNSINKMATKRKNKAVTQP